MLKTFRLLFDLGVPPMFWWVAGLVLVTASAFAFIRTRRWGVVLDWAVLVATVEYGIYILSDTLFLRLGAWRERSIELWPFEKYRKVFIQSNNEAVFEFLMNIGLYIPMGVLLGICCIRFRHRDFLHGFFADKGFGWVILTGFVLSVVVEACQYIFSCGLCETADVIHNTLGCAIGCGTVEVIRKIWYPKTRLE